MKLAFVALKNLPNVGQLSTHGTFTVTLDIFIKLISTASSVLLFFYLRDIADTEYSVSGVY